MTSIGLQEPRGEVICFVLAAFMLSMLAYPAIRWLYCTVRLARLCDNTIRALEDEMGVSTPENKDPPEFVVVEINDLARCLIKHVRGKHGFAPVGMQFTASTDDGEPRLVIKAYSKKTKEEVENEHKDSQ